MCYSCVVRCHLTKLVLIVALSSCKAKPAKEDVSAQIQRSEEQAAQRDADRECARPIAIYDGSIPVNASEYLHSVARGEEFVDEPIADLDRVLSKATRVRFTLDYPFDRPLAGEVMGPITLRRSIDAIRAGFRLMYSGTTERALPGVYNKDVTGAYGRAFHAIGDLVIERIDLCADETFAISIGS